MMNNLRMAMIDDNKTVLTVTSTMLQNNGIINSENTMDLFDNPDDFLKTIEEKGANYYGIIIVDQDFGINKLGGLDIVRLIQYKDFCGAVIFFTGDASISAGINSTLVGNIHYIVKNSLGGPADTIRMLSAMILWIRRNQ